MAIPVAILKLRQDVTIPLKTINEIYSKILMNCSLARKNQGGNECNAPCPVREPGLPLELGLPQYLVGQKQGKGKRGGAEEGEDRLSMAGAAAAGWWGGGLFAGAGGGANRPDDCHASA